MRPGRRGFALIIVLIAVAAVFALALQGAASVRSATIEARVLRERVEAHRGARNAAVLVAVGLVSEREDTRSPFSDPSSTGVGEGGAEAPSEKPSIELPPIIREMLGDRLKDLEDKARDETGGDERAQRLADGGGVTGRARDSGGFRVLTETGLPTGAVEIRHEGDPRVYRVTLVDAGGQLDLNTVDGAQFVRYLTGAGVDPERAAAIADQLMDWRDDDDFQRPQGAEQETYNPLGVVCRNGRIIAREELLYLPAVSHEIFERIRDDLSTAGDERLHAGSASRAALASLPGLSAEVVDEIIRLRQAGMLTDEALDRVLPIAARAMRDQIRASPSNIIRVRVEAVSDAVWRFEGLIVLNDEGVQAVGLRAL